MNRIMQYICLDTSVFFFMVLYLLRCVRCSVKVKVLEVQQKGAKFKELVLQHIFES